MRDLHSILGHCGGKTFLFEDMAESRLKSTRHAPSCGHPIFNWDTHNHCFPCSEKGKGQDICVIAKEEDCFNCLQFTSEQRRKLRFKHKKKPKEMPVSKDIEDNLLGNKSDSVQRSPAVETSQLVVEDPWEKILKCLDDMQSQISSLKSASSSSLPTPHQKRSLQGEQSGDEYSTDQDSFHESASFSSKKRDRSPSAHEEVDDDPSYRETLAAIRTLLNVEVPEESADQPTKIFKIWFL